jgi:ketosteroid isomerase-like protein
MASERAELARSVVKAFNDRDFGPVLRAIDKDVEFVPLRSAIEGPYHGHEGMRRWWADTAANWETFQLDMQEYRDVGENGYIARGVIHARGKGGGVPLDIPTSWSGTWRDLHVVETTFYFDQDAAPRAVGLDGW